MDNELFFNDYDNAFYCYKTINDLNHMSDNDNILSTNYSGENSHENFHQFYLNGTNSSADNFQNNNNYCNSYSKSTNLNEIHLDRDYCGAEQNETNTIKKDSEINKFDAFYNLPYQFKQKGKAKEDKIGEEIYNEMELRNVKKSRKYFSDCIFKKIKVYFWKYLLSCIKNLQIRYGISGKLKKFSQNQITKINIKYEYETLLKPIIELFKNENFSENKKIIKEILEISSGNDNEFLKIPLYEHYLEYLNSDIYRECLKKLEKNNKNDKNYLKLYEKYSKNYVNYFFSTAHNHKRKKK
jgi:hypothetical protein